MSERRVVITGIGVVSPIGVDVPSFWNGILEGRSGAGPVILNPGSPQAMDPGEQGRHGAWIVELGRGRPEPIWRPVSTWESFNVPGVPSRLT